MGLRDVIRYLDPTYSRQEERADAGISMGQWLDMITNFSFNGINYTLPGAKQEDPSAAGFTSMTRGAFKGSGIVAALIWNRMDLFSEVRFTYQADRESVGRLGSFQ